ncbi:hypothetical protein KY327_02960 [Candidatus Woesearchaeota archaeon]|nr:hypothetical protein [Candidatus Woesearchaeota archaeon]
MNERQRQITIALVLAIGLWFYTMGGWTAFLTITTPAALALIIEWKSPMFLGKKFHKKLSEAGFEPANPEMPEQGFAYTRKTKYPMTINDEFPQYAPLSKELEIAGFTLIQRAQAYDRCLHIRKTLDVKKPILIDEPKATVARKDLVHFQDFPLKVRSRDKAGAKRTLTKQVRDQIASFYTNHKREIEGLSSVPGRRTLFFITKEGLAFKSIRREQSADTIKTFVKELTTITQQLR